MKIHCFLPHRLYKNPIPFLKNTFYTLHHLYGSGEQSSSIDNVGAHSVIALNFSSTEKMTLPVTVQNVQSEPLTKLIIERYIASQPIKREFWIKHIHPPSFYGSGVANSSGGTVPVPWKHLKYSSQSTSWWNSDKSSCHRIVTFANKQSCTLQQ